MIDAYALIFRAYYAFIKNPRINSKGINTSAVFGFTNALLEVIRNEKPTHLAVVFDPQEDRLGLRFLKITKQTEMKRQKISRSAFL